MVEIEDIIGSKIVDVYYDGGTIRIGIEKSGKKYTIECAPSIDATFDDCTINDDECYDLLIICRVIEDEEG